jgi:hypothetical protein
MRRIARFVFVNIHNACYGGHEPTMPWRFRRIVRAGPMRGWISRSGLGFSFGFPGFRIGVAADGKRYYSIGIPGTGLYFFSSVSVYRTTALCSNLRYHSRAGPRPSRPRLSSRPRNMSLLQSEAGGYQKATKLLDV